MEPPRIWTRFVILGAMRYGSNALEERLSLYPGLSCHGEAFNPGFIGRAGVTRAHGTTLAARDADPVAFLARLDGGGRTLSGFRLFADHDPRVLTYCLNDVRCAKIVLTRSAIDSYVSLKIARSTGQWWLGDLSTARPGQAWFDAPEFETYLADRDAHHAAIRRHLQVTGQVAFHIDYSEIGDDAIVAGLAGWLGVDADPRPGRPRGRVQNPVPLAEKVANHDEMRRALAARDPFGLETLPSHEPPRGPAVRSHVAGDRAPVIYMPIPCAQDRRMSAWMDALNGGPAARGLTQREMNAWMRRTGRHMRFTVVSHPLDRAHEAFCRHILPATGPDAFTEIRSVLARSYGVALPDDPDDPGFDAAAHGQAFLSFLEFLSGNLAGQTSIRVDPAWASQDAVLRGMARFALPDVVLRAERLQADLPAAMEWLDMDLPPVSPALRSGPHRLCDIHTDAHDEAVRRAYRRDFLTLGYGPWQPLGEGN